MNESQPNIFLATTSPYKIEQFKKLGFKFKALDSKLDEDSLKSQISDPHALSQNLAQQKALNLKELALLKSDDLIIASDQVLALDTKVYSKPKDKEHAFRQLKSLSGKKHQLITALCIIYQNKSYQIAETNIMHMRDLSDSEIIEYLDFDQAFDCVGCYKIESHGIKLFKQIESHDFSSIIGLPLIKLNLKIRKLLESN